MKQITLWMLVAMLTLSSTCIMTSCSSDDNPITPSPAKPTTQINITFASKAEGQRLMRENTQHYADMSQDDIDWRMRKENSTIDELKAFALEQVRDFTDEEKSFISKHVSIVQDSLNAIGCHLPIFDNIVFIKTTMAEEGNPMAYTIKNEIFIGEGWLQQFMQTATDPYFYKMFTRVVAHELFHCITRNSPEFRRKMYSIIGFTVMDHDIVFPENIKRMILQNPDVEHIDSYAVLTINGRKRQCALIALYSQTFSEAYAQYGEKASMLECSEAVLVPLDEPGTKYKSGEVPDFWEKVGRNTDYVLAPEECMADNFSFAVAYGWSNTYESPKIIRSVISTLKSFKGK